MLWTRLTVMFNLHLIFSPEQIFKFKYLPLLEWNIMGGFLNVFIKYVKINVLNQII